MLIASAAKNKHMNIFLSAISWTRHAPTMIYSWQTKLLSKLRNSGNTRFENYVCTGHGK
jgi:hypothetical protein